jgi:tetratricopeptide (TPR) repeat protein
MITVASGDRQLLPRWRSLTRTLASRELFVPGAMTDLVNRGHIPPELTKSLEVWRARRDIQTAGELVETALVAGRDSEAREAAAFLLSGRTTATSSLKRLASLVHQRYEGGHALEEIAGASASERKRLWRTRTRLYPHSALAWVELALHEMMGGKPEAAKRSISVALQLAPTDRHVVRSASRLFIHLLDPERAYHILRNCRATPHDPWLIAAELAVSGIADRKPRFFAEGRKIALDGQLYPRQVTELCGALASLELDGGRRKKARNFFQQSVVDPTGNALAQAEWASNSFSEPFIPIKTFSTATEADEAKALYLNHQKQYSQVPAECERWAESEPYSIRPYELGSSAAALAQLYDKALQFSETGLKLRPDNHYLSNNRAFVLANLGRLDEAEQALKAIPDDDTANNWLVSEANRGLIQMRRGNVGEGVAHYVAALTGFRRQNRASHFEVARVFLARELALQGVDEASRVIKAARDGIKRLGLTEHAKHLDLAEAAIAQRQPSKPRERIEIKFDGTNYPNILI